MTSKCTGTRLTVSANNSENSCSDEPCPKGEQIFPLFISRGRALHLDWFLVGRAIRNQSSLRDRRCSSRLTGSLKHLVRT